MKENIELSSTNTKKLQNYDVLIIDNKELKEIKFVGNLDDPKIDEFISLYIHEELYRDIQKLK